MYAWKGVAFLLVAVCANIVMCGVAMRPWPVKREDNFTHKNLLKIFEPRMFCSIAFDTLLVSNCIWSAGTAIVFFYLPGGTFHSLMFGKRIGLLLSAPG